MADFVDPVLNSVLNAMNGIGRGLNVGELSSSVSNLGSSILGRAMNISQNIMGAFKIAQNALMQVFQAVGLAGLFSFLISFITMVTVGFSDWELGIRKHLDCAAEEYRAGWRNQGAIINILAPCTWEKFITFLNGSCTRYYIVDMVLGLLYGVFVELPLILIRAIFGIDLQVFVDICWNVFIVPLDALFYALSGFHFINWSDDVINRCYRCKGKYTMSDGRTVTLYKTWAEWAELLKCGNEQMVQGFMRIFTSLIPSPKWWEWANGRNQSPPNWEPKVLGY